MIRITRSLNNAQATRISVEGQIVNGTACQVHAACTEHLESGRSVELSLAGVSFVDRTGLECLRALREQGLELIDCSGFLQELLRSQVASSEGQSSAADTDADLIARLRTGDAEAFERMVRLYGSRMLATATRLLGNDADAQDATQEALLAAYRAIDRFEGNSMVSTWLHRIVVNTSLERLRRKRRKPEESIDHLLPRFEETREWADASGLSPGVSEALIESSQTRAMVRACIERLPVQYRAILLARDIEELNTSEAAKLFSISITTAKARLHRARQALKTLIERESSSSSHKPSGIAPSSTKR